MAPASSGIVTATVNVGAANEANPANNPPTPLQTTVQTIADLGVSVIDSPDPVLAGGTINYQIAVTDAVGVSDRALEILQIEQSDRYRTNLGLAEVTGSEVTAIVPDSTVAPKLRPVLEPYEFTQLNSVLQQMNLGIVYNGRLSLKAVAGDGRLAAYGSIIDQQTQDPTYVPAQ